MERKKNPEFLLREAFERLKKRKPRHPQLKKRASAGLNLVSITNVALEAGVSRTLIGYTGCRYPELRAEILKYMDESPRETASYTLVQELRAEIRDFKKQLQLRDTYIAELTLEVKRLNRDRGATSSQDPNVVPFRRKKSD